mmetsp:Transcript_9631/g.16036  ORF Transcript_9631/g.16036 Transcript_9631/m.16036 type:complete len:81 (+) Transcript_9631:2304-2546(+)
MSEIGGITELQILQQEIALTKKQLEGIQGAEMTSVSCTRIAQNISKAEEVDGFLVKEGGMDHNQFHTSGPAAEEGCCVVL